MSTSIAANVPPRPAAPETHPTQTAQTAPHEDTGTHAAHPVDGIPFASPVIKVDSDTGLALLVVRDSSTGEELDQYPSKKAVEEYQRVQNSAAEQVSKASSSGNGQSLAADAKAPPAPVAAPSTGSDPASTDTGSPSSGKSGVRPVTF